MENTKSKKNRNKIIAKFGLRLLLKIPILTVKFNFLLSFSFLIRVSDKLSPMFLEKKKRKLLTFILWKVSIGNLSNKLFTKFFESVVPPMSQ